MSAISYAQRKALKDRRVQHSDGRVGVIERIDYTYGSNGGSVAWIRWPGHGWARREDRCPVDELQVLDPPQLSAPVRTRRVVYKGTKEQVAERLALMGEPKDEVERYVEFTASAIAARRWRIVEVGYGWEAAEIKAMPNESPRAEATRRAVDFRDY